MPGTRPLLLGVVLSTALSAGAQYVPPVLKGVKGEGTGRHADQPIPFPAENEPWILAQSKHFTFISSAGERKTRDIAEGLETMTAALTQLTPRFSQGAPAPTRVFIFARHKEAQPYFDLLVGRHDAHVTGLFVSQKQGGSMIIETGQGWRSDRTPFHELIHYLIANTDARPPLWLEEGLSEYFSNAEFRRGSIYAGMPVQQHVLTMQHRNPMPVQDLLKVVRESDTYNLPAGQQTFYAESWAIVDALMRTDHKAFYDFLGDVENGATVEIALRNRFHQDLGDLQRVITGFGGRPQYGMSIPVPDASTSVKIVPLDRADLLYHLGRFLGAVEDGSSDAERHFREALRVNPQHARSMAALKMYEKAIAADPNDPDIHLEYAESLLGKQIGPLAEAEETTPDDVAPFRKARALAQRALALGADPGRAWGDIGTSYMVESDFTPGIAALEKSRALLPGRKDFAVHLFALYRRAGDKAKADALFAILERMRDPQVAYAARATMVRVELARANALVQQQKLDEAAAVLRDLAANTDDADAKQDLARQADEMVKTAETNRQIDAYNKAVGEVQKGRYDEALKTLKALLLTATEPEVIRDARKLQAQLELRKKL